MDYARIYPFGCQLGCQTWGERKTKHATADKGAGASVPPLLLGVQDRARRLFGHFEECHPPCINHLCHLDKNFQQAPEFLHFFHVVLRGRRELCDGRLRWLGKLFGIRYGDDGPGTVHQPRHKLGGLLGESGGNLDKFAASIKAVLERGRYRQLGTGGVRRSAPTVHDLPQEIQLETAGDC